MKKLIFLINRLYEFFFHFLSKGGPNGNNEFEIKELKKKIVKIKIKSDYCKKIIITYKIILPNGT